MTLSLDEVRSTRFHLARRNGYEVSDVDTFVDKVEATMTQLVEENGSLWEQLSSLKASAGDVGTPVRWTQPDGEDSGDAQRALEEENARLRREVDRLTAEAAQRPAGPTTSPAGDAQTADTQQAAVGAPQHLVVTTSADASPAVVRLVQLATEQSETLVAEATAEAARLRAEAEAEAARVREAARDDSERTLREAGERAAALTQDAEGRATNLDAVTEKRRAELLHQLEAERARLNASVAELREFEAAYRRNLTQHLREQLAVVAAVDAEPVSKPKALTDAPANSRNAAPAPASPTPRLDRLLHEH